MKRTMNGIMNWRNFNRVRHVRLLLTVLVGLVLTAVQPIPPAVAAIAGVTMDITGAEEVAAQGRVYRVTLGIEAGDRLQAPADWWLLIHDQSQWRYLDLADSRLHPGLVPTYQGGLINFSDFSLEFVLEGQGTQEIYFGVDLLPDGGVTLTEGLLHYDRIEVTLVPDWWRPQPGTSWQWQLTGTIDTGYDVDMYDVDLFETPQAVIDTLKRGGKKVICYFSAGSWEDFRDDADRFPAALLGNTLDGWPDERWLDIRDLAALSPLMTARLDLAVEKGCDGVEPDNLDGYQNDSGFALTREQQLAYNRWLATEAHRRSLSVGLKNALDLVPDLVDAFDWALNEQCFEYGECTALLPFIEAGRAVFGVEYNLAADRFCARANAMDMDWLVKDLDLGAAREACR